MLCFNYTVGFPLSATVLSRLLYAAGATRRCRRAFQSRPARATPASDSLATIKPAAAPSVFSRGPDSPTLRANPFPEVTDPFSRLPLPTFFYQLEAANLGDLMRL